MPGWRWTEEEDHREFFPQVRGQNKHAAERGQLERVHIKTLRPYHRWAGNAVNEKWSDTASPYKHTLNNRSQWCVATAENFMMYDMGMAPSRGGRAGGRVGTGLQKQLVQRKIAAAKGGRVHRQNLQKREMKEPATKEENGEKKDSHD